MGREEGGGSRHARGRRGAATTRASRPRRKRRKRRSREKKGEWWWMKQRVRGVFLSSGVKESTGHCLLASPKRKVNFLLFVTEGSFTT